MLQRMSLSTSTKSPFEHWRTLTRNISSPEIFIEGGFYMLTAAALQRRVWNGTLNEGPLFPNMFMLFVAPPGVAGKGLVTDLIYLVLEGVPYIPRMSDGSVNTEIAELLAARAKKEGRAELTIPVAPQNITFEKLVQNLAKSTRTLHVKPPIPAGLKGSIYEHKSIFFNLDELTSFIDEDAKKVVPFLLSTYNCKYYDKETKHQGDDRLSNCCLNLIAGTQPDTFQELARKKAVSSGLTSRMFLLYADAERQRMHKKAPLDDEQLESLAALRTYIKNLSEYFGRVTETDEADQFVKNWWDSEPATRANKSNLLIEYYSRKQQHVMKLAMLDMFSRLPTMDEDGSYKLTIANFTAALAILARWEVDMHMCFKNAGENKIGSRADDVVKLLKPHRAGLEFEAIFHFMMKDLRREELGELLMDLVMQGKLMTANVGKTIQYRLS